MEDRPLDFWDIDEWRAIVAQWPETAKKSIGSNLRVLQHGEKPASHCKTLQDFPIALLELWHACGARVICTTDYASLTNNIHVLDAFMKDSQAGKKMRQADRERIERRATDLKKRMVELKKSTDKTKVLRSRPH